MPAETRSKRSSSGNGGVVPSAATPPTTTRAATSSVAADAPDGSTEAPLPEELRFERVSAGIYRLVATPAVAGFDVTRWDAVAEVTLVPLTGADHEVRFVGADGPVDTAFSFRVEVRR